MSGTITRDRLALPTRRRLGIEGTDLGDHLHDVLGIDAADRHQLAKVTLGQQVEVVEQRGHRRIKPVTFRELGGEAFPKVAREQARRIEPHHARAHRFDAGNGDAQCLGHRFRRRGEPAGRAQQRDQMGADQAIHGVVEAEPELLAEMFAQRATAFPRCRPCRGHRR